MKDHPKIHINTDTHADRSCALCIVNMDCRKPSELGEALHNQFKIHTTAIEYENVQGVRITPHVYTVKADLDRLITALLKLANT